jgi:hypothetical protein
MTACRAGQDPAFAVAGFPDFRYSLENRREKRVRDGRKIPVSPAVFAPDASRFPQAVLVSLENSWQVLLAARESTRKTRHSIAVSLGALRLSLALEAGGLSCDHELGAVGGLLHDIAHGQPYHARAGAEILERLGWDEAAFVVGCHTALPPFMLERMHISGPDGEYGNPPFLLRPEDVQETSFHAAALVFLADKYILGVTAISIAERFENIRLYSRRPPSGRLAARQRVAEGVERWFELSCRAHARDVLQSPSGHPREASIRRIARAFEAVLRNPAYRPRPSTYHDDLDPAGDPRPDRARRC